MVAHSPLTADPVLVPQRLPRGYTVGRYVVDGWVRDGGMASLYRGHHITTGATVALKVQLGGDDEEVTAARFAREGEVIGRLSGVQNIVQIHDADDLGDGRRYVVMEWIEGDNLEELIDDIRNRDERFELDRACRLMKDVALALDATHRARVVHRDLKPSNIMVDWSRPDRELAKLVDYGISADLGEGGSTEDLTQTGMVLGTSGYMAPEQALGLPADPSFDLYAFGVILFEVITGLRPPPLGMGGESLPDVGTLRRGVPPELSELVAACLSRDPKQRPDGATVIAATLDSVGQALSGQAPEPAPSPGRWSVDPGSSTAAVELVFPGAGVTSVDPVLEPELPPPRMVAAPMVEPVVVPPVHGGPVNSPAARSVRWPRVLGVMLLGALALALLGWVECEARAPRSRGSLAEALDVPDIDHEQCSTTRETDHDLSSSSSGSLDLAMEAAGWTSGDPSAENTTDSSGPSDPAPDDTFGTDGARASTGHSVRRDPCHQVRRRARDAAAAGTWSMVIRDTQGHRCWSGSEHARVRLRVNAYLQRGDYRACIRVGTGSTDSMVIKSTKFCRDRMMLPSG